MSKVHTGSKWGCLRRTRSQIHRKGRASGNRSMDEWKWLRSGLFAGERGPPRVSGLGTAGRQAPLAWASVQVSGNRRKVGPDAGASAGETGFQPVGGDDIGRQALLHG